MPNSISGARLTDTKEIFGSTALILGDLASGGTLRELGRSKIVTLSLFAHILWAVAMKPPRSKEPKMPGRNSPCPCGSGRKYKHCCLRKDQKDHHLSSLTMQAYRMACGAFINRYPTPSHIWTLRRSI